MGVLRTLGWLSGVGASVAAYSVCYERTAYTLRRAEVPVLPRGERPMRILHLSDLHMTPNQTGKQEWLRDLARLLPDLVVLTGDVLSDTAADAPTLAALRPLFDCPGAFVPGNNDYFTPRLASPTRYFTGRRRHREPDMDWASFAKTLAADSGWHDLTNVRTHLTVDGRRIDVRGVDDPYLKRDRLHAVSGPADPSADLRLGLSHAPEPRVLDAYTRDGVDLTLAGHTHGGQIRLPGVGAIVTNCGIDRARARGLAPYGAGGRSGWLHVSAGLGTSPYAPVRFGCRPESTLLTLVPVR